MIPCVVLLLQTVALHDSSKSIVGTGKERDTALIELLHARHALEMSVIDTSPQLKVATCPYNSLVTYAQKDYNAIF